MTFTEFVEANGYEIADGNIVDEHGVVQHQNVFSTLLTAWLASEHVFGSEAFAEWFEDALDGLVGAGLTEEQRDTILGQFALGGFSIVLNQNSEGGAPYIEFTGFEFLTDLLDFESLFADAASHTWTKGKAEQVRWYFDTFLLGEEPPELGIAFFPTQEGNDRDPIGNFYVTGSQDVFEFSVEGPDGITIHAETGELGIAGPGQVAAGTYAIVVTATDEQGNETTVSFTLLVGTNGADTMPDANFILDPAGNNILIGFNGADTLTGSDGVDYILGSNGADHFNSSLGADWYLLGNQNDTIHYTDVGHSAPDAFDTVMDWDSGNNTINLSAIDGLTAFAGETANVVANSITWHQAGAGDTAVTIVQGDVNGDTDADLMIVLLGHHELTAADFVLA